MLSLLRYILYELGLDGHPLEYFFPALEFVFLFSPCVFMYILRSTYTLSALVNISNHLVCDIREYVWMDSGLFLFPSYRGIKRTPK